MKRRERRIPSHRPKPRKTTLSALLSDARFAVKAKAKQSRRI
jgi:hypothetical protein